MVFLLSGTNTVTVDAAPNSTAFLFHHETDESGFRDRPPSGEVTSASSVLRLYFLSLWKSVSVLGPFIPRPFKVSCHGYRSTEPASSHAFQLRSGNHCGIKSVTGELHRGFQGGWGVSAVILSWHITASLQFSVGHIYLYRWDKQPGQGAQLHSECSF